MVMMLRRDNRPPLILSCLKREEQRLRLRFGGLLLACYFTEVLSKNLPRLGGMILKIRRIGTY